MLVEWSILPCAKGLQDVDHIQTKSVERSTVSDNGGLLLSKQLDFASTD
jgi:hypothetical protein